MKLYLYYENEEALHDTSVESFQWKNSSFRIGGLLAILQERHASLS
jgi:hypothetical protein